MSVHEFLNLLFGEIPNLFKNEDELRKLWSVPVTRKALLNKLEDAGFGQDNLITLQKIINTEKCDLFDILEFIAFSKRPITREAGVARAQHHIFNGLSDHQKGILDFVLEKYIQSGVEELGDIRKIKQLFTEFQPQLYNAKIA